MRRKNGEEFTVIYSGSLIQIDGQTYSLNSIQDVSEWRRSRDRVAAFAMLGRRLNAAERLEEAAQAIADVSDTLFGWDAATLNLLDATQTTFHAVLDVDVIDGHRQPVVPPLVNAPLTARMRRVLEHGPELELRQAPFASEAGSVRFGDVGRPSASLMTVPLREGPRAVGVLSIQSYRPNAYTAADLETLQSMAEHCTSALVRILAMDALTASEARFRAVWDNATDGMKLSDADGRIVAVNDAYCRIMRRTRAELEGALMCVTYAEADRSFILQRYREHFAARRIPAQREFEVVRWDGQAMLLEVDDCYIESDPAHPLVLGVFRDITDRRRAELEREKLQQRVFQHQKFEALGTLAGGIAHDFNNILAGMLNYVMLAQDECPEAAPAVHEYLSEVLKGGHRARELVRQILLLSRSETAERAPVQLALVVREALSLLRSSIAAGVEIVSSPDTDAPLVLANATQMHQVVMNLGINAAYAMRQHGGRLTVTLAVRDVPATEVADVGDLRTGRYVCLDVTDTGTGIPSDVLPRIFEPFFTTKDTGEGTGLGLSVVRSVMQSHGGAIAVRSTPRGTMFRLYLPALVASPIDVPTPRRTYPRGQGQRVWLVDDEPVVAQSMTLMLERLGYTVRAYAHPAEALVAVQATPQDVDLLITDNQMPGLTGPELVTRVRAVRPDLPIVIATGFSGALSQERIRELRLAGVLRKPFDLMELAQAVAATFASRG